MSEESNHPTRGHQLLSLQGRTLGTPRRRVGRPEEPVLFLLRRFFDDLRGGAGVLVGMLFGEGCPLSLGMPFGHCFAGQRLAGLSDFSPTGWTFDIH